MLRRLLAILPLALGAAPLCACATLHKTAIDEIDAQHGRLQPFEIHVSDTGLDAKALGAVASVAARSSRPSKVADIVALFEFGPKTGDPVFSDTFADHVVDEVLARCPSGRVTGLVSLRESAKYAVASGEVVTVRGFCILD